MKTLQVALGERSYPIYIGAGSLGAVGALLRPVWETGRVVLLADESLRTETEKLETTLRKEGFSVCTHRVTAGEEGKNGAQYLRLLSEVADENAGRDDLLLAFGGGTVGDLAGFVAATYRRGMRYAVLPTTLLAQADSAVGGKNGLNLPAGKNMVGTFYQPQAVIIDPALLDTLPEREKANGMAEVIKCAMIGDAELFSLLENSEKYAFPTEEVLYRCCALKAGFVAADEQDRGARHALNFGHTFGHAYERAYGFSTYAHGEAVAAGMTEMLRIQGERKTAARLEDLLSRYGLPTHIACPPDEMRRCLLADKKNGEQGLTVTEVPQIGTFRLKKTSVDALADAYAAEEA